MVSTIKETPGTIMSFSEDGEPIGHFSKSVLARDFIKMTNDNFFVKYGFNYIPTANEIKEAHRELNKQSWVSITTRLRR